MRPETPGNQGKLTLTGHPNYVLALAIAPDGSWLASASWDNAVRIWDVDARRCVTSFRTGNPLAAVLSVA